MIDHNIDNPSCGTYYWFEWSIDNILTTEMSAVRTHVFCPVGQSLFAVERKIILDTRRHEIGEFWKPKLSLLRAIEFLRIEFFCFSITIWLCFTEEKLKLWKNIAAISLVTGKEGACANGARKRRDYPLPLSHVSDRAEKMAEEICVIPLRTSFVTFMLEYSAGTLSDTSSYQIVKQPWQIFQQDLHPSFLQLSFDSRDRC